MKPFAFLLTLFCACSLETSPLQATDGAIAGLTCATDQVAKWQGDGWVCAEDETGSGGDGAFSVTGTVAHYMDGNVGIGTTTPTGKLEVTGTVEADGFTIDGVPVASSTDTYWSEKSGNIYFSSGNVGVGNDTPAEALSVTGNILATGSICNGDVCLGGGGGETDPQVGTLGADGQWCTTDGSAVNCTSAAPVTTESDPTVAASVKDGVSWTELSNVPPGFVDGVDDTMWSASVDDIYYDSGNVGIGTTSPGVELDVSGDARVTGTMRVDGTIEHAAHYRAFTLTANIDDGTTHYFNFSTTSNGWPFLAEVAVSGYRGFQSERTNAKKWAANCAFSNTGEYQKNITPLYEMGEEAANLGLDVVPFGSGDDFKIGIVNGTGGTFYAAVHITILSLCPEIHVF